MSSLLNDNLPDSSQTISNGGVDPAVSTTIKNLNGATTFGNRNPFGIFTPVNPPKSYAEREFTVGGTEIKKITPLERRKQEEATKKLFAHLGMIAGKKDYLLKLLKDNNIQDKLIDSETIGEKLEHSINVVREKADAHGLLAMNKIDALEDSLIPIEKEIDTWFETVNKYKGDIEKENEAKLATTKTEMENLRKLQPAILRFINAEKKYKELSSNTLLNEAEISSSISQLTWLRISPSQRDALFPDVTSVEEKLRELEALFAAEDVRLKKTEDELATILKKKNLLIAEIKKISYNCIVAKAEINILEKLTSDTTITTDVEEALAELAQAEQDAKNTPSEVTRDTFQEKYNTLKGNISLLKNILGVETQPVNDSDVIRGKSSDDFQKSESQNTGKIDPSTEETATLLQAEETKKILKEEEINKKSILEKEYALDKEYLTSILTRLEEILPLLKTDSTRGEETEQQVYVRLQNDVVNLQKELISNPSLYEQQLFHQKLTEFDHIVDAKRKKLAQLFSTSPEENKRADFSTTNAVLRDPLSVTANPGQKIDVAGQTTELAAYQDELRASQVRKEIDTEFNKLKREAEAEEKLIEKYEKMYFRNPEEFVKIYTYKTWLRGDPAEKIVKDILIKKGDGRAHELEKKIQVMHNDLRVLVMAYQTEPDTEQRKNLQEREATLREEISKVEAHMRRLQEYYQIYDPQDTINRTRQTYSPSDDSSLARFPRLGVTLRGKEKRAMKVAINDQKNYQQTEARDGLTLKQVQALGKDEVPLTNNRPYGALSITEGMSNSLAESEATGVKNSEMLKTDAYYNEDKERVALEKKERKMAAINKIMTALTKITKGELDKALGILSRLSGKPTSVSTSEATSTDTEKAKEFGDIIRKMSWRDDFEGKADEMKFVIDITKTGNRFFPEFIAEYAASLKVDINNPAIETKIAHLSCVDVITIPGAGGLNEQQQTELSNLIKHMQLVLITINNNRIIKSMLAVAGVQSGLFNFDTNTDTIEKLYSYVRKVIAETDEEEQALRKSLRK